MMSLKIHTAESAPAAAQPLLQQADAKYGFTPNLLGAMAHAPAMLEAYMTLSKLFDQTSLSVEERQVVLLAVSVDNGCAYCVAAHTAIAEMQQVSDEVVEAIRSGAAIRDDRLEALRRFAAEVASTRGWPSEAAKGDFFAAGFTEAQALEVILGVGMKTLSNYTNHFAQTPLDGPFQKAAWEPADSTRSSL